MILVERTMAFLTKKGLPAALWMALTAFVLVLAADQASKYLVVEGLNLRERGALDVIDPFLNFRMAWNTGVNFGIGGGNPEVTRFPLVIVSVLFAIGALVFARRSEGRLQAVGLGVAAGGALGNAIDRLSFPEMAVADFLNMSCCGIDNPYSFNVADIAIFAGIGMAVLLAPKPEEE